MLGGIEIAGETGLAGHSDADVVLHALIDALLGAAALGDIGAHFPSSDPRLAGVASREMLRRVVGMLADRGYTVVNVDITAVAERPRLAPHIDAMRRAIAADVGVPADAVSVKATTTDGLGALGRGEGIAAMAVALIE